MILVSASNVQTTKKNNVGTTLFWVLSGVYSVSCRIWLNKGTIEKNENIIPAEYRLACLAHIVMKSNMFAGVPTPKIHWDAKLGTIIIVKPNREWFYILGLNMVK